MKCKKCCTHDRYQHPQTGKVYPLCPLCGWEQVRYAMGLPHEWAGLALARERLDQILVTGFYLPGRV